MAVEEQGEKLRNAPLRELRDRRMLQRQAQPGRRSLGKKAAEMVAVIEARGHLGRRIRRELGRERDGEFLHRSREI